MKQLLVIGAVALAAVVPAPAQDRPDFSGRWTPATPAGASTLTVTQDAKRLVAEIDDGRYKDRATFVFGVVTPQEGGHPDDVGITSLAEWKGAALTVTITFKTKPDGTVRSVREEVWTLDQAGQLIIESTARRGDAPPVKSPPRVFRKV